MLKIKKSFDQQISSKHRNVHSSFAAKHKQSIVKQTNQTLWFQSAKNHK